MHVDGKNLQENILLENSPVQALGELGPVLKMEVFWEWSYFVGLAVARIICTGAKGEGGQGFWGFVWKQVKVTTHKTNQFRMHKSCQQPPNTGTPNRQPEVGGVGILV